MLSEIQLGEAEEVFGVVVGHGYSSQPDWLLAMREKTWKTDWADLDGS
jgi:hypothetical protein